MRHTLFLALLAMSVPSAGWAQTSWSPGGTWNCSREAGCDVRCGMDWRQITRATLHIGEHRTLIVVRGYAGGNSPVEVGSVLLGPGFPEACLFPGMTFTPQ